MCISISEYNLYLIYNATLNASSKVLGLPTSDITKQQHQRPVQDRQRHVIAVTYL